MLYRETALLKNLYNNNLDVYIHKIRSYLEEDEGLEILTIKGIGYRFVIE